MALDVSLGVAASSQNDAQSAGTLSWTPPANTLLITAYLGSVALGSSNIPTCTGNGLTWTHRGSQQFNSNINRVGFFTAMGASPTTGSTVVNFAGQDQNYICLGVAVVTESIAVEADAFRNLVSSSATGTTPTTTLGAFADSRNATVGIVGVANDTAVTPEAGWTELFERQEADSIVIDGTLAFQYILANDTSPSASIASNPWGMLGFELVARLGGSRRVLLGVG